MKFPNLDAIYPKLNRRLDSQRYYHSLGVMQIATAMALELGLNSGRAALAGLLHDCERCESIERLRAKIARFKIELPPEEEPFTSLYHTYAGAYAARIDFGVKDPQVLRAISLHATGDADMTKLDKLIYIADLIDPSRGLALESLKIIRSLAFKDLDQAFRHAIAEKHRYCTERKVKLNPRSKRMIAQYLSAKGGGIFPQSTKRS